LAARARESAAHFRLAKPSVGTLPALDRWDCQHGSANVITQQAKSFGRRGAPRAGGERRPTASPVSPAASGAQPSVGEQLRGAVLKMLVLIPATVGVVILTAVMVKNNASPTGGPSAPQASAASGSSSCRAKATAGSIFDIDWCQAAAAAARGAASGVAAGAGRR
jgi:hypothetical protein